MIAKKEGSREVKGRATKGQKPQWSRPGAGLGKI